MHPSDPTLLALIQGELGRDDVAELWTHLARCDSCAASLEELRRRDGEVGRLLSMLDHPVPRLEPPMTAPRPRPLRRALIAAGAALFAAGVAAASVPGTPVYRWIRERIETQHSDVSRPAPAPISPGPAQAAGGIELPAPNALIVQFTATQPGGVLTVAIGSRPVVSLRAFGGAVAYRVGDGRLVVDNDHPAGHYALEIPAELGRLTITANERVIYRSDTAPVVRSAAPDTVSLDPGPPK